MVSKKEETKKDHLRWMLTFSDMMTLLLAFFVLLISMSSLDQEKLKKVLNSLKGSLGVLELGSFADISMTVEEGTDTSFVSQEVITPEYFKFLKSIMQEIKLIEGLNIRPREGGYILSISNKLLFSSGSSELKDSAKEFVDNIIKLLRAGINHVEVQGFSDNKPVRGGKFSSNWDLSASRAVSVVKYMIGKNLEPKRFTAVSFGETHSLYPNITPEFRGRKRRVEIIVDSPISQLNLYVKELVESK